MTGLQKKCAVALLCVLLLLGLITYASFQIEYARMPTVMAMMPTVDKLTTTREVSTSVSYITQDTCTAQANYKIASVNAQPGQLVTPTDTLLTLDMEALTLEQLRLQAALEDAEAVETDDLSAYEAAVHEQNLDALRVSLEEVTRYISTGGEVRASGTGYLRSIAGEGAVRTEEPLSTIALTGDGIVLRWEMSAASAIPAEVTGTCLLPVSTTDVHGNVITIAHEVKFGIGLRRYDQQSGRYLYESKPIACDYEIDEQTWRLDIEEGKSVPVTLRQTSGQQLTLIPVSAIRYESETIGKVYILMEEEDGSATVQDMQINIIEQNGEYAGVQREFVMPVVTYTDKALTNGASVKTLN